MMNMSESLPKLVCMRMRTIWTQVLCFTQLSVHAAGASLIRHDSLILRANIGRQISNVEGRLPVWPMSVCHICVTESQTPAGLVF